MNGKGCCSRHADAAPASACSTVVSVVAVPAGAPVADAAGADGVGTPVGRAESPGGAVVGTRACCRGAAGSVHAAIARAVEMQCRARAAPRDSPRDLRGCLRSVTHAAYLPAGARAK